MLILFEDGVCEELSAERLPDGTFRLVATPLATSSSVRRGDVLVLREEGKIWRLERVAVAAPHVTLELAMTGDVVRASGLRALFERVEDLGGEWERAYGGVVLIHIAREHAEGIEAMLRSLTSDPAGVDE